MVDCGNPRCAQERRFFKKELLSWSKKVPLMIALEQIAANYSDKENFRRLANPYASVETEEEREDWVAVDCCFYCQGQLSNSLDHLEELLQDAKNGKLDTDSSYVRSLQELLPFYVNYYTQGVGRELLAELGSRSSCSNCPANSLPVSVAGTHTPLDSRTGDSLLSHSSHKPQVELRIPQLLGRGLRSEGQTGAGVGVKRGYTEEDLEAAVADIKGGKIGTRRASTLYGIPRSTLRNKVFRSSSDMDRASALFDPEYSNSDDEIVTTPVPGSMKMAELVQTETQLYLPLLPFPLVSAKKEEYKYAQATMLDEFSAKLEHIRRMHNLKGDRDLQIKPAHINELKLPLLTSLIRRLVEQRFQLELSQGQASDFGRDTGRGESDIVNSPVMEERKHMAISVDTLPHFIPYLPSFSPSCLALSVSSAFEDLRIPSYKPAHDQQQRNAVDTVVDDSRPFGKVYETSRIGETLKDIIVKSISEKMKFHDVDTPPLFSGADDLFNQTFSLTEAFPLDIGVGKLAFHSCHSEISQPTHPAKRIKRELCDDKDVQTQTFKSTSDNSKSKLSEYRSHSSGEKKSSGTQSAGSSGGGSQAKIGREGSLKEKKTRPKRGQYRKYNSQLLIEAVRAVQRGEMSVHRAGSYFGVPHSTLEYKVKERHLLRQKKPKEGCSSSSVGVTTSSSTSTSNTSSSTTTPTSSSSSISTSSAQTSKVSLLTSTASSDSSTSSTSSSSQTLLGPSNKADVSLPLSSSPTSSLSALGFGLHKQGAGGSGSEFPWFQPYLVSGASHSPFDPALSLFPQGFALNTSASELLRKLQHKVQSKSSPSPFSSESSFGFSHPNGSSSLRESFLLFN